MRIVEVTTQSPSPFASSLLFGYVAQFLYEGDSPLAERRAAALTVDPTLLAELLGHGDGLALRDLLDPNALADIEAELQRLAEDRRARNLDEIADLLRILGPMTTTEIDLRSTVDDVGGGAGRAGSGAAGDRGADRRRGAVGGSDRRADPAGRARHRPAAGDRGVAADARSTIRSAGCSAGTPAPTGRSSRPNRRPGSVSASRWSPMRCAG